jgi:hypothetical protein
MPGDCLPASFNGKACYFRLDKKAKRTDTWTVGVCNKGTADTAGEKPGRGIWRLAQDDRR